MKIRLGTSALLLVITATILCSCSDDDVVVPPDDSKPIVEPPTEDMVIQNFRVAYEDMDFVALQNLLHPDFVTFLQEQTIAQFPDVGRTLDRDQEIRIAQRMFSGQPVTDPDGKLIAAISSVEFQILEQQGVWTDTGPNGVIPNARAALFDVLFIFDRPGDSTLPAQGQIRFFVSRRDSLVNGVTRTYYTMIGQQDLTNTGQKGVEEAAWGSIKALYR